jgi:hypothetical protein
MSSQPVSFLLLSSPLTSIENKKGNNCTLCPPKVYIHATFLIFLLTKSLFIRHTSDLRV